jgi:predicted DNA-binding protein (MmcQ/YjbR family)
MRTHKEIEAFILELPEVKLDYPFGKDVAVYKTNIDGEQKMFALIQEKKEPVNLSLKCDPQLAVLLRQKYESVMPGYHLNKKHWNTIVVADQLTTEELEGLILHSYHLVRGEPTHVPVIERQK